MFLYHAEVVLDEEVDGQTLKMLPGSVMELPKPARTVPKQTEG